MIGVAKHRHGGFTLRGRLLGGQVALLTCLAILLSAAVAVGSVGRWSRAAPLHFARAWETATLLRKGQVLVTGGFGSTGHGKTGITASVELYNAAKNRWSIAQHLHVARFTHTATLLKDGTVLVAGGANLVTGTLSSSERYDPARNRWVRAASLRTARVNHTATLLRDGRVLVVGGGFPGHVLRSAELYDPVRNVWSSAGQMHVPRYHHTATLLPDGRVLVAGGEWQDASGNAVILYRSAEIYDPRHNTWTYTGAMSVPRANHAAVALPSGRVLVAGGGENGLFGSSAEIYEARTGKWRHIAAMHSRRGFESANLLPSHQAIVTGGSNGQSDLRSAEIYDPARNRWLPAGQMYSGRSHHAAVVLRSGRLLAIGGLRVAPVSGVEMYSP